MGETQSENITITKLHEKVLGKTVSHTHKFHILRNALKTLQTSREERNWRNMTRKLSKNYKLTSYFFYFFSSPPVPVSIPLTGEGTVPRERFLSELAFRLLNFGSCLIPWSLAPCLCFAASDVCDFQYAKMI